MIFLALLSCHLGVQGHTVARTDPGGKRNARGCGVSRRNGHDAGISRVSGFVMWNVGYDVELCLRLSISEVATSADRNGSTLHSLNHDSEFETVLHRIRVTIKDCGNSVDAYYKQWRLGK